MESIQVILFFLALRLFFENTVVFNTVIVTAESPLLCISPKILKYSKKVPFMLEVKNI